jgi:ribosomal protein L37AE/L43A
MNERYWLILEKSDKTRTSKGIDGYRDKTGESYQYDSLVPNHKRLGSGDFVVLRKEDDILGVGRIGEIQQKADVKVHRRCPKCRSTDIRERITKKPTWKCGKCAHEFAEPEESRFEIQSFVAAMESFSRLNSPPSVSAVKRCAIAGDGLASQLSILELDRQKIQTLLEGVAALPPLQARTDVKGGQGFGLSYAERVQVEWRAMQVARELYEQRGWDVVDTSASHPYDLYATQQGAQRFIEVKGTTGQGESIMLTNGEVKHAQCNASCCALVVVSGITLVESEGIWSASGGRVTTHQDLWKLDETRLQATEFRYSIAGKGSM